MLGNKLKHTRFCFQQLKENGIDLHFCIIRQTDTDKIPEELEYINSNFLGKFEKVKLDSITLPSVPFINPQKILSEYPISSKSEGSYDFFTTFSFVAGNVSQRDLSLTLKLLGEILINQPSSPIKKALQKADVSKTVSAVLLDECYQNVFQIISSGINKNDQKKIKTIIFNTLNEVVKRGIKKIPVNSNVIV